MDLHGKRALVMGLGVHGGGLGVARFLVEQGARVTVTDLASPEALAASLAALDGLPIRYVLGEHRPDDFRSHELVVQNPGVPRESPYLAIARAAGAVIESEMTLFFRFCPNPANLVGVTGTKGKTTTTLLAGAMFRQQYPHTVVAGNLRVSALEQLPHIAYDTPVVLELSSWQLEGLGEARLSPKYACVTNLSPDHLNRYGSMEEYGRAKQQIFLHQAANGVVVLNGDDPVVSRWAAEAPGEVIWFTGNDILLPNGQLRQAFFHNGDLWWQRSYTAQRPSLEHLLHGEEIFLPGLHNRANVAAAAALARSYGITPEHIQQAVLQFEGVPHRSELVRILDDVRYVNDTAATAPAAAMAALEAWPQPIVLLAGGSDKRLPFDEFARAIGERVAAVVLLDGSATPRLQAALDAAFVGAAQVPGVDGPFNDFERAIRTARERATPGGTVLLAPGCASFGMFQNEFQRGDEFKRIVLDF
jgi:UDP-N-acetylmuramoylalanine--D-glutamate ligase